MRLCIVSHCPPLPSWGGAMTFFRHFIERTDFETLVVTPSHHVDDHPLPYDPVRIQLPPWWRRASQTRFLPWLYPCQVIWGDKFLSSIVLAQARRFKPDAIFTVAGNWDWTALAAQRIARELEVPLIASFNDWYDYGWFPVHDRLRPMVEKRFRRFYQEADLALCTSEGMREALGEHSNAHVWYPTGAPMEEEVVDYLPVEADAHHPLTVFFGGSLGDWYGPMLESLVRECESAECDVQFLIYGALEAWSQEFDDHARAKGIFRGRVDFPTLQKEAEKADILILPMGFGEDCAHVERTSFKTKFLDYLSFQRPILVWGPEYCSAVRVAREFDSAECVTDPSPRACRHAIDALAKDPDRRQDLIANAMKMYQDRFHPDQIHEGLVRQISSVVSMSYEKSRHL